jgi:hypothetical protein
MRLPLFILVLLSFPFFATAQREEKKEPEKIHIKPEPVIPVKHIEVIEPKQITPIEQSVPAIQFEEPKPIEVTPVNETKPVQEQAPVVKEEQKKPVMNETPVTSEIKEITPKKATVRINTILTTVKPLPARAIFSKEANTDSTKK